MASEQFSLCWDNFHKNMSSGMNSLLENEDLVDVTLAVEGKYLKAHKMVLSVCSPYFKELFKSNPCKHPIVFMKDVSYVALSDLLQFMYQGEVQVSQENLTTFIKTAEALQIKGLTGDGNGSMDNEVDHEKSVQQLVEDYKPEYKPSPSVPRPKKLPPHTPAPAPKRQRLSTSSSEVAIPSNVVTKTEPVSNTSSDVVQFKMEPYDQTQTISIQDDDDHFVGEGLDDTAGDDTEDYSMMEGNEEEPQAGTSAEGSGEGQEKCNSKYLMAYVRFEKWCEQEGIENFDNEQALLDYFEHLSITLKPSSLCALYSMLRSVMSIKKNIDITKFASLTTYLKMKSEGYQPQKSRILTKMDVAKYLQVADDKLYLMYKVALIIGLAGACNREELTNLPEDHVIDEGHYFRIIIPFSKSKISREFIITSGDVEGVDMVEIIRKYLKLRPVNIEHRRFFVSYKNGKCTKHPIGKNTIGSIPNIIASYLELPCPEQYTAHCFRRSSASLLVDIITVKRHGGWIS